MAVLVNIPMGASPLVDTLGTKIAQIRTIKVLVRLIALVWDATELKLTQKYFACVTCPPIRKFSSQGFPTNLSEQMADLNHVAAQSALRRRPLGRNALFAA